jgi:hypothetical protein
MLKVYDDREASVNRVSTGDKLPWLKAGDGYCRRPGHWAPVALESLAS